MKKILVIDDEEQIRELLVAILEREGFEVTLATNGDEATRLLRKFLPDLVITDLIMPGKEGLETIMELRRSHPGLPVIAISGGGRNGTGDYLKLAKGLGAKATVSKPFRRDEILEAVRGALGGDSVATEPV